MNPQPHPKQSRLLRRLNNLDIDKRKQSIDRMMDMLKQAE